MIVINESLSVDIPIHKAIFSENPSFPCHLTFDQQIRVISSFAPASIMYPKLCLPTIHNLNQTLIVLDWSQGTVYEQIYFFNDLLDYSCNGPSLVMFLIFQQLLILKYKILKSMPRFWSGLLLILCCFWSNIEELPVDVYSLSFFVSLLWTCGLFWFLCLSSSYKMSTCFWAQHMNSFLMVLLLVAGLR